MTPGENIAGKANKKHRKGVRALAVAVAALVVVATGLFFALRAYYRNAFPQKYQEYVERYAAEYQVDPDFVYAVIKTESNFRPSVVSANDACGLMQLLPSTLEWLQTLTPEDDDYVREDLFSPEINIKYGVYFLSVLFKEFHSPDKVAAAYHAGINGVRGWLKDPEISPDGETLENIPYPDTRQYVERIEKYYRIYQTLYK